MGVQQHEPLQHPQFAQPPHRLQHLTGGQAEFGFLAAGVLPLASADGGQAHPHSELRRNPEPAGLVDDPVQFGQLFDHDEHLEAQPLADQRQPDVFAILVTVAHHHPAGLRQPQHRQQFRLAASFQPDPRPAVTDDFADHPPLLVDLDRIDGGIPALIIQLGNGAGKGVGQGVDPVVQDVAEADQHRRPVTRRPRVLGQRRQLDARMLGPARRPRPHPTGVVDLEVAVAPAGGVVYFARLGYGPGRPRLPTLVHRHPSSH